MRPYNLRDTQYNMDKHGRAWWKCDEASGNLFDSKGNFTGTVTNITRTTGVNGNALIFNGNSSRVDFSSPIIPLGKKSIRFKFKSNSPPSSFIGLINSLDLTNASGNNGICVSLSTSGGIGLQLWHETNLRFNVRNDSQNVCDGQWHDILMTWDGSTDNGKVKVYIDDMVTPSITGTSSSTDSVNYSGNLTIGTLRHFIGTPSRHFNGQLDEIEIYNDVINPLLNKSLILSDDNNHYSYNNSTNVWTSRGVNLTQNDWNNFGMYPDNVAQLNKTKLLTLPNLTTNKPKIKTFKPN